MKKNIKINNIRALAILAVVLGHSIIIYSSSWNLYTSNEQSLIFDCIKQIINLFQMPLFFSLSGYVFYYTAKKNYKFSSFFKNKCKRIIIPYLIIGILWMLPLRKICNYPGYNDEGILKSAVKIITGIDNGHLWFLQYLFAFLLIAFIANAVTKKFNKKALYIIRIFAFVLYFVLIQFSFIPQLLIDFYYYLIWFYAGYIINIMNIEKYDKLYIKIIFSVLTVLSVVLHFIVPSRIIDFIATTLIVATAYLIMTNKESKVLSTISKDSFGIYLFHSPLIYISFAYYPDIPAIFMLIINFVGFGLAALILTEIYRKLKLKFIIGE